MSTDYRRMKEGDAMHWAITGFVSTLALLCVSDVALTLHRRRL